MSNIKQHYDVIIVGAGAAGLMAAIQAGKKQKKVLLVEHSSKIGEKIRISGGGRCNFTNLGASPQNYISENPHFVKSSLATFTQHDFMKLVEAHKIAYHEKTLGQLFCDGSSQQIIDMLVQLCKQNHVHMKLECQITDVVYSDCFSLQTSHGVLTSNSLVIASGGLSIPKMGASDFGYRIAKKFGHKIIPPRPALVPLIVTERERSLFTSLSGVSNSSLVSYGKTSFAENILFTHKGLSGPAILQISSYLTKFDGEQITIDLLPKIDLKQHFLHDKNSKQILSNYLKNYLPNRFVDFLSGSFDLSKALTDCKKDFLFQIADSLHTFKVTLSGNEGFQKAEVTAGGVDTNGLSSKTMESKMLPRLFFIGEVVDVTGWLGGYNFQWAWSSGYAAGNAL
jgi:predicted Rossmann fold flavoprotein